MEDLQTERKTNILENTNEFEPSFMINERVKVQLLDDINPGNYYSRVEDATENTLMMTWPTDKGVPLPVHLNQMLGFSLVHEDSAYSFNGVVDKVVYEPLRMVEIIIASTILRIQRRENFRIKCLVPIEFIVVPPDDSVESSQEELNLKTNTYDLSASGVSIRSAKAIATGTIQEIILSLLDERPPIKTSCRVVHCFVPLENPDKFHIGMQFLELDENSKVRIVRFIYNLQLNRIRE